MLSALGLGSKRREAGGAATGEAEEETTVTDLLSNPARTGDGRPMEPSGRGSGRGARNGSSDVGTVRERDVWKTIMTEGTRVTSR
jgi:hypothetical protein